MLVPGTGLASFNLRTEALSVARPTPVLMLASVRSAHVNQLLFLCIVGPEPCKPLFPLVSSKCSRSLALVGHTVSTGEMCDVSGVTADIGPLAVSLCGSLVHS